MTLNDIRKCRCMRYSSSSPGFHQNVDYNGDQLQKQLAIHRPPTGRPARAETWSPQTWNMRDAGNPMPRLTRTVVIISRSDRCRSGADGAATRESGGSSNSSINGGNYVASMMDGVVPLCFVCRALNVTCPTNRADVGCSATVTVDSRDVMSRGYLPLRGAPCSGTSLQPKMSRALDSAEGVISLRWQMTTIWQNVTFKTAVKYPSVGLVLSSNTPLFVNTPLADLLSYSSYSTLANCIRSKYLRQHRQGINNSVA